MDTGISQNSKNVFDNSSVTSYNNSNDVNAVHIVKMDEQVPINDTGCKHENLIPDLEDTLGDAVYNGCANPKCGVGFYIRNVDNK